VPAPFFDIGHDHRNGFLIIGAADYLIAQIQPLHPFHKAGLVQFRLLGNSGMFNIHLPGIEFHFAVDIDYLDFGDVAVHP